ncbi:hypothetical protein E9840_01685 [Tissierella creatinini]|nr:hypothetical protein E9840_01685 [Tissierella creatinini]TJX66481.1 hypothetical protein E8P77_07480 [Soehngenia saccharolytica]
MSGKYFFGLILILLGGGILLEQLGFLDFGDLLSLYWPSILIILGVIGLFNRRSSKTGNLIIIGLGVILQLNRLNYVDINIFRLFFPAVLIIIGLSIIFGKGVSKHNSPVEPEKWSKANVNMEDTIDLFVIFSGNGAINQSSSFKGGKVTAILGGIDLDLRQAQLKDNNAFLDVTALFGGVEIKVPDTWRVEMKGTPIFGGIENQTRPNPDLSAPVLKINATAMFGGVDIKN